MYADCCLSLLLKARLVFPLLMVTEFYMWATLSFNQSINQAIGRHFKKKKRKILFKKNKRS